MSSWSPLNLPRRLWVNLVTSCDIADLTWAELSKVRMRALARAATATELQVTGKGTFKDEFVTAGGAALRGLQPKSFESRNIPGLFLAGEVIDVDGITGGYNFLNAWSSSWCAGTAIAADACDS